MLQLFAEIFAKQGRASDRRRINSGLVQSSEGARRGRRWAFRIIFDSEFGIGECAVIPLLRVGPRALGGIIGEGFAKAGN